MTELARASVLGRANLYKALSSTGNPEFATVAKVLRALEPAPALSILKLRGLGKELWRGVDGGSYIASERKDWR